MTDYLEVPEAIVRHVRLACAHLPEAYEEQASRGCGCGSAATRLLAPKKLVARLDTGRSQS